MKGEVMFENSISDPMVATTSSLLGSKWSVLLLNIVMQDAMTKIFHFPQRIQVSVDDMKLFLKGMSSNLLGRRRYLFSLLKAEIKKVRLELSVTNSNKVRKNKPEVSNPHSRQRLRWFCREDVFGMDSSIEYWGIDNRTILDEFLGGFFRYCR